MRWHPYKPMDFLQWMYHRDHAPKGRLVKSERELSELGAGWHDTPTKMHEEPVAPATDAPPMEAADVPPPSEPYPAVVPHLPGRRSRR